MEDIKKDYYSTNIYTNNGLNHISKSLNYESLPSNVQKTLQDVYLVKEEYFKVWEDYIKENYGTFDSYIRDCLKISDETRNKIKEKYLEIIEDLHD